ncbi:MAG: squalene/phytoene synthase family protein [Planctomycetota bacterium]|jgi:phytoene/squalene synthetase
MISFSLQRPWLLLRYLAADRDRPDLGRLRVTADPERFVWEILPHAARTFASCIALLPAESARAAAVAYLYCRMLDTYEDLVPDADEREAALTFFARRLEEVESAGRAVPAPEIPRSSARDARDLTHLLLVERCEQTDRVHLGLAPEVRALVRDLVRAMGEGMCAFSRAFREQGGVLLDDEQVREYCRTVIGHPVVFTLKLLAWQRTGRADLGPALEESAMVVGEMIQLANITRDIEKDLRRGIAYHPSLREDLGKSVDGGGEVVTRVRAARRSLLRLALERAPSYRHVMDAMRLPRVNIARASALLMLLYTDRHYRSCARRAGIKAWAGRAGGLALIFGSLPAALSRGWADRLLERIVTDFRRAAALAGPSTSSA